MNNILISGSTREVGGVEKRGGVDPEEGALVLDVIESYPRLLLTDAESQDVPTHAVETRKSKHRHSNQTKDIQLTDAAESKRGVLAWTSFMSSMRFIKWNWHQAPCQDREPVESNTRHHILAHAPVDCISCRCGAQPNLLSVVDDRKGAAVGLPQHPTLGQHRASPRRASHHVHTASTT
eukprot:3935041-Rhodomonas_salina.1